MFNTRNGYLNYNNYYQALGDSSADASSQATWSRIVVQLWGITDSRLAILFAL
jgi:hypothetical protein